MDTNCYIQARGKYPVLSRENSSVTITVLCVVYFEAVACGLDGVSNKQLKCADVSGIRLSLNYSL